MQLCSLIEISPLIFRMHDFNGHPANTVVQIGFSIYFFCLLQSGILSENVSRIWFQTKAGNCQPWQEVVKARQQLLILAEDGP